LVQFHGHRFLNFNHYSFHIHPIGSISWPPLSKLKLCAKKDKDVLALPFPSAPFVHYYPGTCLSLGRVSSQYNQKYRLLPSSPSLQLRSR
jgi:hypothetical protein